MEDKVDTFVFTKIKTFVRQRQLQENEKTNEKKIFANHIFDQGLISGIYKKLLQFKKKKDKQFKDWQRT